MADPTAPGNNNPQDPNNPNPQTSPIQPGQFVTAQEEENGIFKQPPSPQPPVNETVSPPTPPPQPINLAGSIEQPAPPPTPTEQPQTEPQFANQPSPTPYVPPQASGQPPQTPPTTIGKLRIVLIILGFLLLIGLIAAVAWLFVFNKSTAKESAKTEPESTQVEVPSPPPARKSGGFSQLPQATEEAEESTTSAE